MAKCVKCVHYDVCVRLGKPSLYGINKELGCDKYLEVVRCKGCKDWMEKFTTTGIPFVYCYCDRTKAFVKKDDFCSYGERREGE